MIFSLDMTFQKGHKIFLGRKHSEETKKKMSLKQRGRVLSDETKEKIRQARLGTKWSEERKRAVSEKYTGSGNPFFGKSHSMETRVKLTKYTGAAKANWKGGITPEHKRVRSTFKYRIWKNAVKKRDNYTCVWCGSKKELEADHIQSFAYFPELRYEVSNGRTLCRPCHKKTDSYGKYEK